MRHYSRTDLHMSGNECREEVCLSVIIGTASDITCRLTLDQTQTRSMRRTSMKDSVRSLSHNLLSVCS